MVRSLVLLLVLGCFSAGYASAGMVSTQDVLDSHGQHYSVDQLQVALASSELQSQMLELGVDPQVLSERIASLTPQELVQLNAELESKPAGGIVGVLLTIFIVFIITDMLCATEIFSFVKCINK